MHCTIHPAKRVFDIVFTLFFGAILTPFMMLVLFAILTEHILRKRPFDPFFYSETRMSAGLPFTLYKFNIFRDDIIENMHATNTFIHTKDLERNGGITHIGWCLKQIYMDELPQLWCVLRGDMSIVGPRPVNLEVFRRFMNEGLTDKIRVKAGLTGPFQSLKDDRTASAHLLDRWYADFIETNTWYKILWNDIRILVRTIKVVAKAKGL